MVRGSNSKYSDSGPTDAELSEFLDALGGQLEERQSFPLTDGSLLRLIEAVLNKGYAMRLAPSDRGRARHVVIYLTQERRAERSATSVEEFEERVRELILAVEKLPAKRL